ncbi:MAG TPA: hypothetical protein VNL98_12150 [Gemmatimonadales bacterium]|nr:hypothetical protein [Gemmatimonadales bacterium]
MPTATLQQEPIGLVIQDGGEAHDRPRILMWYWASEDETPAREREDT